MESQQNADAVNFAKQTLEAQAKEMQDKTGGAENSSVVTAQVVVPSDIGKKSEEVCNFFSKLQTMHDFLLLNYWTSDAGQTYDTQASSDSLEKFEINLVYLAERILILFSSHW